MQASFRYSFDVYQATCTFNLKTPCLKRNIEHKITIYWWSHASWAVSRVILVTIIYKFHTLTLIKLEWFLIDNVFEIH